MNIKQELKGKLTKKEMRSVRRSYDIVGSIAILEIPRELLKKEKTIAQELLKTHKNIKTAVKKIGAHEGRFRIQKMKHISGLKTMETIHKENNVQIKLDIEKVYFSPRLASERLRIAKQVKPGEKVLVMFSGCGPYPLVISRNSKAKEITGIELNRIAHKYAEENAKLNKLDNIKLIKGDANKILEKSREKYDRVIMPMPKGAKRFLICAIKSTKKTGVIHYYDFLSQEQIPDAGIERIRKACNKVKRKFKILKTTRCGQLAPRMYRVCFDVEMR